MFQVWRNILIHSKYITTSCKCIFLDNGSLWNSSKWLCCLVLAHKPWLLQVLWVTIVDYVLGWVSHLVNSFTVGMVLVKVRGLEDQRGERVKGHRSHSIYFHSSMAQVWCDATENKDLSQHDWTAETHGSMKEDRWREEREQGKWCVG